MSTISIVYLFTKILQSYHVMGLSSCVCRCNGFHAITSKLW